MGGLLFGKDNQSFIIFEALKENFNFVTDFDVFIFELGNRDGSL